MFWAQFHDFCVQKRSCALKSRRILEVFTLHVKKVLGAFSRFLRPKVTCLPLGSDAFWMFSAGKVYSKKFWAQFHDLCFQKTKQFADEFRRILEVFALPAW